MIPYLNETRDSYIQRMKDNYLDYATVHYELGNNTAMWLGLMYYAMTEDLYGEHWDCLQKRGQA